MNYIIFLEVLTINSSSRTRKNSPTKLTKLDASMVGIMFIIITMNY